MHNILYSFLSHPPPILLPILLPTSPSHPHHPPHPPPHSPHRHKLLAQSSEACKRTLYVCCGEIVDSCAIPHPRVTMAVAGPPLTPDLKSTNGILAGQFSVPSHPPSHGIPSHREGHSSHSESHSPYREGHTPHRESHSPHREGHTPHREVTSSPTITTPHRKCNDERTLESRSAAREEGGGGEVSDQPSQQVIKVAMSRDVPSGGPAGSGVPNEGITPMSGHSGLTRHTSSQSELFHTPKSSPVPSPPPSPPPMPRPPPTVGCIVGCWPRVSKMDTFFSRVIHKCVSVLYVVLSTCMWSCVVLCVVISVSVW